MWMQGQTTTALQAGYTCHDLESKGFIAPSKMKFLVWSDSYLYERWDWEEPLFDHVPEGDELMTLGIHLG